VAQWRPEELFGRRPAEGLPGSPVDLGLHAIQLVGVVSLRSPPLGKYWGRIPFAFPFVPRRHGEGASQKYTRRPAAVGHLVRPFVDHRHVTRPAATLLTLRVRAVAAVLVPVTAQLAADRRCGTSQLAGDPVAFPPLARCRSAIVVRSSSERNRDDCVSGIEAMRCP
jgi:hypothetical protein